MNGKSLSPNLAVPETNEVTGLQGRHRLQKTKDSPRNARYLRTGSWIEKERENLQAYEYLCHIGEVKEWIESVIGEEIASITSLDEDLRNGIVLAKMIKKFEPKSVKRIFEGERLQYRHSDNINYVFDALNKIGLPDNFKFELTDLYEKKNIPKVIYCLHALSHLLYKRGLAPSINNLVGYLQFTDEQIHSTQKQLDTSGVALPAFKQVRSQLAREMNEPVTKSTTELDLTTQTKNIVAVQRVARGYLVRKSWMDRDEQAEQTVALPQAYCRGYLSRKAYKNKVTQLQQLDHSIVKLQAYCRGSIAKKTFTEMKATIQNQSAQLPQLQSLCRGALARKKVAHIKASLKQPTVESGVTNLQAVCKSVLTRKVYQNKLETIKTTQPEVVRLQALCKSHIAKKVYQEKKVSLSHVSPAVERLQARARTFLVQKNITELKAALQSTQGDISRLQAIARGHNARHKMKETKERLCASQSSIVNLQATSRGVLARKTLKSKKSFMKNQVETIINMQALARGCLSRKLWGERTEALGDSDYEITRMQGLARGVLVRSRWTRLLASLDEHESSIMSLQAIARGHLARKATTGKMDYFQEHEEKVIKIQSVFRAKMAKRAYYEMSVKDDPPVSAMRNFLYLLDDSEADFTAELELEKLRQKVVRTIRENKSTESELSELDIKIALLVKNRITIDEVVKSSKGLFQSKRSSVMNPDGNSPLSSSSGSNLSTIGGAFSLKNLDRDSRNRLKNYQFLFYLLQTQPSYLARMLVFNKSQMGDRAKKFIETVVLTLFNFAQNNREEYLLLKLFKNSIEEEINSVNKIEEFLRGNPVFIQLAVHYNRGAKERKYLRDLLQPLIKPILEDKDLDLETDPVCIYRGVIREEESRTGTKSKRKYNVTKQSALNDPETKAAFIKHLQQLRSITSDVIDAILESLDAMPYGVRYIAKELKLALTRKFPYERPATIIKVVGHLVYYRYINPAITAPELFDVIETVINSIQRKNLAEIAKMLNQVSMGKLFSDENIFLQPLNNFIGFTAEKFARYFQAVTEVDEPEVYFGIDEFSDQVNTRKPTIYISYNEIISLHRLLADNQDLISPSEDDPIHPILQKLGPPPQLMNYEDRSLGKEIALVLSDPAGPSNAQAEATQQIFLETKRQVLYVIKVQSGATLLEILNKPVTADDEQRYASILDEEIERSVAEPAESVASPSLSDSATTHSHDSLTNDFLANLRRLTFQQLKTHILKNMANLEEGGMVSTENGYQAMVNAIARDIKNKHQRRSQRIDEFRKVRQTLGHLNETSGYLAEQKQSYHSYISTCMSNLRAGKSKGRHKPRPFSRQYFHAKGLERAGKMPKFGSYKYGADDLYRRGILISIAKFNPSEFGKMSLTISSDEMGVFHVEASLLGIRVPNAQVELRFDELLQAQFDNIPTLSLFDDTVKVNVNLLLYLINKKFYI